MSATSSEAPIVTPLHIVRLAEGDARALPLVLLHGFTGDRTTWRRFVAAWRDAWRDDVNEEAVDGGAAAKRPDRTDAGPEPPSVWAVDLVGHGRSPDPTEPAAYRLDAQSASVCAALEAHGIHRAIWLGYSMGGRVALTAALAHPDRVAALALVSTSPGIADAAARAERLVADAALAALAEAEGVGPFVERWARHPLFATQDRLGPAHAAAMRAQRLGNRAPALGHTLRQAGAGAMAPLWDRLGEVSVPVLIVTGALDARYAAIGRAMAVRLGSMTHVEIPAAGHAVQIEAPQALAAATALWLHGHRP